MSDGCPDVRDTDWSQDIALYDQMVRLAPSPIVRLNRAIAVAELDGPEVALAEVDGLPLEDKALGDQLAVPGAAVLQKRPPLLELV